MIYPWQQALWGQLAEHWSQQPHAWLLHGQAGTGRLDFARHLAAALLCESPQADRQPCGRCAACHLLAQDSHPDLLALSPEIPDGEGAARKLLQIKVDAVRAVLDFAHLSSHRGGWRVVLIHPAESLNLQAANALLKVLEEPPPQVRFILVGGNKDALLPTIKSRCRLLALPPPAPAAALAWLQQHHVTAAAELLAFHGGAPLFTAEPEQDALRGQLLVILAQPRLLALLDYAAVFDRHKLPLSLLIDWLYKWLLDLALSQRGLPPRYYPGHQDAIDRLAAKTDALRLFALLSRLQALAPYGRHTLNVKMQAEDWFIDYLHFCQAPRASGVRP